MYALVKLESVQACLLNSEVGCEVKPPVAVVGYIVHMFVVQIDSLRFLSKLFECRCHYCTTLLFTNHKAQTV